MFGSGNDEVYGMPMSADWDGEVLSKIEAGKKGEKVIFWQSSGSST